MNLPAVATSTAVATPTFDDLLRIADTLSRSRIIPQAYRGRAEDVVAAGLAGQAFGWDVMTSLRNYHVIEGTATLRPEAMLGLVRRHGHSVMLRVEGDGTGKTAYAHGERVDNGDTHVASFSLADAERAGLAGKKNWKQYADSMLTWRAVSSLCRVLFPDVVLGAGYVPEEIGSDVDVTGTPVEADPFGDPLIPIPEAKRMVLAACDGDKETARSWWDSQHTTPGPDGIRESILGYLLDSIESGDDIEDALVVHGPEDPLVAPVSGDVGVSGVTGPEDATDPYSGAEEVLDLLVE